MCSRNVVDDLLAALEAQRAENERLREQIRALEAQLSASQRGAKRQAAPFSKGEPKTDPKRPGRRSGEEHGRHGHRREPDHIDETVVAELPQSCPYCGGELETTGMVEQVQEELPQIRPLVRRIEIPVAHCRGCGERVQGRHALQSSAAGGAAKVQLGPRALAMAASLNKEMGLSLGKTAAVLEEVAGLQITRGGLSQALARIGERCLPTYQALSESIRQAELLSNDETGWRVGGRSAWLWIFVSAVVTVYAIRPGRGFEEAASVMGENFEGILVRDGWAPYRRFLQAEHQTCLAHILRRCHEILEVARGRAREVPHLVMGICQDALELRDDRDAGRISPRTLRRRRAALESRLDALLTRPGITRPDNRRLLDHLERERDALFTFLYRPGTAATNWQAEQGLRPAVVNRKVWGGNRTWSGAATHERLISILRTCRQQALNPITALTHLQRQPQPGLLAGLFIPNSS